MRWWVCVGMVLLVTLAPARAELTIPQAKQKLQGICSQMRGIEGRLAALKKPPFGMPAAQEEAEFSKLDAALVAMEKEIYKLDSDLTATANSRPADPGCAASEQKIRETIQALSEWHDLKRNWIVAGAKNPGLKTMEANEPVAHDKFKKLLAEAEKSLK